MKSLRDQASRHDLNPDSAAAKLSRARAYLAGRNIAATAPGNAFRYVKADCGSRVLRTYRRTV